MTVDLEHLVGLCVFAFLAGGVDAVVGGGGLIQLPATVLLLPPGLPTVVALGTSKVASLCGTAVAAVTYSRRLRPDPRLVAPMTAVAFAGALLGARLATLLPSAALRPLVLVLLVAVGIYTWRRPDLGAVSTPRLGLRAQLVVAVVAGGVIGAYDGFFGPGTGSFLVFGLVGLAGLSFLRASATAKVVNTGTNLAALIVFGLTGAVLWPEGLAMAACNVAGSVLGASVALRRGDRFVRAVFLVVVSALVLRLSYDVAVDLV